MLIKKELESILVVFIAVVFAMIMFFVTGCAKKPKLKPIVIVPIIWEAELPIGFTIEETEDFPSK